MRASRLHRKLSSERSSIHRLYTITGHHFPSKSKICNLAPVCAIEKNITSCKILHMMS